MSLHNTGMSLDSVYDPKSTLVTDLVRRISRSCHFHCWHAIGGGNRPTPIADWPTVDRYRSNYGHRYIIVSSVL